MSAYTFRDAIPRDCKDLVPLMLELGYRVKEPDLLLRIKKIQDRGDKVIIVEYKNHVVGVVQALVDIRLAEGVCGEIVSLVVKSRFRGKGVGKLLVNNAKSVLVSMGCSIVRVRANSVRDDAHSFYYSIGFVEKKTQKILEANNV